jgi:Na+/proline symporter
MDPLREIVMVMLWAIGCAVPGCFAGVIVSLFTFSTGPANRSGFGLGYDPPRWGMIAGMGVGIIIGLLIAIRRQPH